MNYPFEAKNIRSARRLFSLALAMLLIVSALSGCSLLTKKPSETSDPSEDNMPNLVETADSTGDPTEEPTEEATEAPTEEIGENMAIVKEQLNVRNSPSATYPVSITLDAGEIVEVLQVQALHGVSWAQIFVSASNTYGWVTADMLDMSHVSVTENNSTPAANNQQSGNDNETATTPTAPTTPSSGTTVSGNTTMGIVTASELNIRSEADSTSTRVGGLKYGDRVTIQETSGNWGRIKQGWISLEYVYVDGNTGKNTCSGTITASQLTVRTGPGTNYDKASTLESGARVEVLEQIKVGDYAWGCIKGGWIRMDYVKVTSGSALVTTPANTETNSTTNNGSTTAIGTATVTGSALNIRETPSTDGKIVGGLKNGETVSVLEKKEVGSSTWGRISSGWICLDYTKFE